MPTRLSRQTDSQPALSAGTREPPGTFYLRPSAADAQRLAAYRAYLDFYNGWQWEGLPAPNEKRLTLNYARIFIHKAASYLMGKGVTFAVEPPDGTGEAGMEIAYLMGKGVTFAVEPPDGTGEAGRKPPANVLRAQLAFPARPRYCRG